MVVASRGYENQAMGGRVRVGTGVIGIVAQKRRMLQVSNLGQQRAYAAAQRRQMMKSGRAAELGDAVPVPGLPNAESQFAIPLLVRDELIGVFSIESPRRRTFSEHDRALVSIVANQIASAINNARLYEERRRTADELQAMNTSLEARVAERTAALERELRVAEDLLNDARSRIEGPLLGDSAAVRALRDAMAREAARREPLLLTGPPGAGKEAVAHAVHAASRRTGAFIFVSCPELHTQHRYVTSGDAATRPESLLLSKLEFASGGTLFLDAVHELPVGLQHALVADARESRGRTRSRRPARFRCAGHRLHDARSDAGHERAARAAPSHAVREPDRRPCPGRAARGHSGTGRPLRAEARTADRQARGRRLGGVDGPAAGVLVARQHPRAAHGARACDSRLEKLGAGDRRGAPRRKARGRQLSPHGAPGLRWHGRGLACQTPSPGTSGEHSSSTSCARFPSAPGCARRWAAAAGRRSSGPGRRSRQSGRAIISWPSSSCHSRSTSATLA